MRLDDVRQSIRFIGPARTLADLLLRVVNRVVLLHLVKAVVLERADPRLEPGEAGYRFTRLDEATLRRFTGDPGYELSERFLREAFARGDECYGFLRGDELAAFSWHTRRPTLVGLPGISLHFSDRYVHIYKGLTHPAHRGRRLHGAGLAKGLAVQRERGALGLVSYVDTTSFAARRSLDRVGFTTFGSTVIVRLFGRYLLWASKGCRKCEFRLVWAGSEQAPLPAPAGSRR